MRKWVGLVLMVAAVSSLAYAGEVKVELDTEKLTEVPNAVLLEDGLIAGGAPTARGLGQAAEQGIRTVIDVRMPKEGTAQEADYAEAVGLNYINIPISVDSFSEAQADELARVLEDPATGPVLLHCGSGQRAVAVWALYRNRHQGVDAQQALTDARQKGLKKPELETKLQTLMKS
ncbi:MAG TPA: protein tyrosine phosphatase family protein [bacterium]|nr:protein tyrosine phosphatase family protein [bacterium]